MLNCWLLIRHQRYQLKYWLCNLLTSYNCYTWATDITPIMMGELYSGNNRDKGCNECSVLCSGCGQMKQSRENKIFLSWFNELFWWWRQTLSLLFHDCNLEQIKSALTCPASDICNQISRVGTMLRWHSHTHNVAIFEKNILWILDFREHFTEH